MSTSEEIPVLTSEQVIERLKAAVPSKAKDAILAMYSSVIGGITKDISLMVVPLDDHIVHRGHAVFDTANVVDGNVYGLKFHTERFFKSAKQARIQHSFTAERVRDIVVATVAATGERGGVYVRMWMSASRGDFSVAPHPTDEGCGANLYVVVHRANYSHRGEGMNEAIVSVPLKPTSLSTLKSTNYLINALCAMEAQENGGELGLQLDERGMIAECSVGSVGFVGTDGVLRSPKMERILRSTTLLRAYHFREQLIAANAIKGFEFCDVTVEQAKESVEMIGFGGGYVSAIVKLDRKNIGDGTVGPSFKAIDAMLKGDMVNGDCLDAIPLP